MSVLGDSIRQYVNKQTSGVFGNGNMKRLNGETNSEYIDRLIFALSSSANTFNQSVKPKSKFEKWLIGLFGKDRLGLVKSGIVMDKLDLKKLWLPLGAIAVVGYLIFKPKKTKRRTTRRA